MRTASTRGFFVVGVFGAMSSGCSGRVIHERDAGTSPIPSDASTTTDSNSRGAGTAGAGNGSVGLGGAVTAPPLNGGGAGGTGGSGGDTGPGDAPFDAPPPEQPASCVLSNTSTIPGVHIEFPSQPCVFTLARVARGVVFHYDVVVDEDLPGYVSRQSTSGVLEYPGASIAGLRVAAVITGGGQRYCVCDQGGPQAFCDLSDGGIGYRSYDETCPPITVSKGVRHVAWPSLIWGDPVAWNGRNWDGPSDTVSPEGAPFPPGDYELDVSIAGRLVHEAGTTDVSTEAKFLVRLVR